jgi:putative membrane protein
VIQVAIGLVVVVSLLSVLGYVLSFWNFRLTRHRGGSLHVSRGLITARATSIEERRLRGVELSQLLPLRAVGGARLLAVATGLRVGRGAERGGTLLLPACPAPVAVQVAGAVLDDPQLPMQSRLVAHGPAARRRRLVRAVVPATLSWLALLSGWWFGPVPVGWVLAGLAVPALSLLLAQDRYASLGHAVTGRYLVTRSGSLHRRRVVLESDGVIGWNLRQSFFQRRAGLLTMTATTAAGRQGYRITDVTPAAAYRIAGPGLLAEFMQAAFLQAEFLQAEQGGT